MVWNDLEMEEQFIVQPRQKKFQNARAGFDIEIESAIDELEVARAAFIQPRHFAEEQIEIERPSGLVERGQAKLALERAAARGFPIQNAGCDIIIGVAT